jgi:hypothetical protein
LLTNRLLLREGKRMPITIHLMVRVYERLSVLFEIQKTMVSLPFVQPIHGMNRHTRIWGVGHMCWLRQHRPSMRARLLRCVTLCAICSIECVPLKYCSPSVRFVLFLFLRTLVFEARH